MDTYLFTIGVNYWGEGWVARKNACGGQSLNNDSCLQFREQQ